MANRLDRVVEVKLTYILVFSEIRSPNAYLNRLITEEGIAVNN